MTQQERQEAVEAVAALGKDFSKGNENEALNAAIAQAYAKNQWFIPENIRQSVAQWAKMLTKENVSQWVEAYPLPHEKKTVGLILAGNIPLVGLHDVLSAYLSGHKAVIKPSSEDTVMIKYAVDFLKKTAPTLSENLEISTSPLTKPDAVIATGTDNTVRYFEYYFKDIPSVIRHSRTSVAVVEKDTTDAQLSLLADDIMSYFGRGCRSVSMLYLPQGFHLDSLVKKLEKYAHFTSYNYYKNNYDYQRAIYTMSGMAGVYDTGFLLLSPEEKLSFPVSVVGYKYYSDIAEVKKYLTQEKEKIQCVSGNKSNGFVPLGMTQSPRLTDYADDVDTMRFFVEIAKK
ncbi:MAG: acyl-CoA reductase [Flavobacteriales bacterium]|nr:acyl-CoA reductase [Flavobacteriales bacterium]